MNKIEWWEKTKGELLSKVANFFSRRQIIFLALLIPFLFTLSFQGCGGSSSSPGDPAPPVGGLSEDAQISFQRIKSSSNGQSFKVIVKRAGLTPASITKATVSKGTLSSWTQVDSSTIEATVTPDPSVPTGFYLINISTTDGKSYQRTPVVVGSLNDRWNQPELFAGSVNTNGWEDSPQAFVTKDANGKETLYLALVYNPLRFDCLRGAAPGTPTNPKCTNVVGPFLSPLRPNMTISSFIGAGGAINFSLPYVLPWLPSNFWPVKTGATIYIFKFANDSYSGFLGTALHEPQSYVLNNNDGVSSLASPFVFKNGNSYSMVYNDDRLSDDVSGCTGYAGDVGYSTSNDALILGNLDFNTPSVELGRYNSVASGQKFSTNVTNSYSNSCPELIQSTAHIPNGLPLAGIQGNPTFYFPASGQPVAIWDLEGSDPKAGYLQMAVLAPGQSFPGGTWNMVGGLPILAAPSAPGTEKSQPVLTDKEFCYRNELVIECASYNGGNPASASSYGTPAVEVSPAVGAPSTGRVTGVGEPSFFTFQNQNCMSFIAAEQVDAEAENLDLKIAWVCQ